MDKMGLNEWLMVISTVLGPILAVQAQKWVGARTGIESAEGLDIYNVDGNPAGSTGSVAATSCSQT
ncbi:DUF6680 family protein [Paraburkholderia sp. SIMBA_030]